MSSCLRIVLAGMVAGDPGQGGATWAVLQYLEGLTALGHDVLLIEPVPALALRAGSKVRAYFESLDLPAERAVLLSESRGQTLGLPFERVAAFAEDADLLLNLSGRLREPSLLEAIDVRAFVDLDPGFTQAWCETGEDLGLDLHTHFLTVGSRLGQRDCPAPTAGRQWVATLPPVSLAHWGTQPDPPRRDAFTTVGNWRSYGSLEHGGIHYGQRAHSLRRLIDLPLRTPSRLQPALAIHPRETADLRALSANGWNLVDPRRVAATPSAYRDFVRESKAELCVAKSGYVNTRCGWFSDRSACYLASGRPVVAQDTGFAESLPVGEGLLAFSDSDQAAVALAEVEADPARHRRAARAIAEEYLDARRILTRMIDGLTAAPRGLPARNP